ncbi:MAG: 50S ribosomal protein L32 [Candidatus Levybacteria bacterium]|nr:50S ribosomal protein L32 [Candidatus Levybacteria bacterium]
MSQEPKKRHSRQRQGKRRAAISLSIPRTVKCDNCDNLRAPHTICAQCGYYKGESVIVKKSPTATA